MIRATRRQTRPRRHQECFRRFLCAITAVSMLLQQFGVGSLRAGSAPYLEFDTPTESTGPGAGLPQIPCSHACPVKAAGPMCAPLDPALNEVNFGVGITAEEVLRVPRMWPTPKTPCSSNGERWSNGPWI